MTTSREATPHRETKPNEKLTAGEWVNLAILYVGMGALKEIQGLVAAGGSDTLGKIDPLVLSEIETDGMTILRRNQNSAKFDIGLEEFIAPVLDTAKIRLTTQLARATSGHSLAALDRRLDFLRLLFSRLDGRRTACDVAFTGADRTRLFQVMAAGNVGDPVARVAQVASIRAPGTPVIHKWAAKLTEACGNPLSDNVVAEMDAADAVDAVEVVRQAELRATALDAGTPEGAQAGQDAVAARAELDKAIGDAANPDIVKAVAATARASGSDYRTKVAASIPGGLVPIQEECVMAGGKVVIAAGAGSGKSVLGDTITVTSAGMSRIDRCAGQTRIPSVNPETLSIGVEDGTWLDMGTSPVIQLETRSGIRVGASPEHPFLVWRGNPVWVRTDKIRAGDFVLVQPGYAQNTGTATMDPEESYLLGLLMGDGWVDVPGRRVGWSRGGDFLPAHFYALAEKFWGKIPTASLKSGTNSVTHWIHSVDLVQRLAAQEMDFNSARDKKVPTAILSGTDEERIRFLQGLMDTDGTATGERCVEWCSASETLARQIHQMLLGLGVVGMLKPKMVDGYDHTYWRILIGGDQLRSFRDEIGFRYEFEKSSDLDSICDRDCNPNVGVYPHVGSLLKSVREGWKSQGRWKGHTQALLMDERWVSVKHYLLGDRNPSKNQLRRMVGDIAHPAADMLRNLTNFYPDEVVSVTALAGEHRVYDFEVPKTQAFIANGIVSHNTRVLAAKVVYNLQEKRYAPHEILAVSFSRRSSAELKERVLSYAKSAGYNLPSNETYKTWGTTHSIARSVLNDSGVYKISGSPRAPQAERAISESEMTEIVKCAIAQVKMKPSRTVPTEIPADQRTFFPKRAEAAPGPGDVSTPVTTGPSPIEFLLADPGLYKRVVSAIREALIGRVNSVTITPKYLANLDKTVFTVKLPNARQFATKLNGVRIPKYQTAIYFKEPTRFDLERFEVWTKGNKSDTSPIRDVINEALSLDRMSEAAAFLGDIVGKNPRELSAAESGELIDLLQQPTVAAVVDRIVPSNMRTADDASVLDRVEQNKDDRTRKNDKSPFYYWYNNAANQWFNLGAPESAFETGTGDKRKKLPIGTFKRYIGLSKSKLTAPGEAYSYETGGFDVKPIQESAGTTDDDDVMAEESASGDVLAAVYGAVEWLKGNVSHLKGRLDYDDQLIQSSRVLVENPRLLARLQRQYRCILVDEAQDLNSCQHLLFGLLAGYVDPKTLKPNKDGAMTAETFALIGDDKQCVAEGTEVLTPNGTCKVENIRPGDEVLSYRNGRIVSQTVRHNVPSGWDWGFKVTTASGRVLCMSPNHKLWATDPDLTGDQHIVYLMHRRDLGFRVGITNWGRDDDNMYRYGQRPVSEKAEKLWVLDICQNRDEALDAEHEYSLGFQVPTMVFHTAGRKLTPGYEGRIRTVFAKYGENGRKILESKNLSFDLPHWIARTFVAGQRYTIQLVAHGSKGTQVTLEVGSEINLGDVHYVEGENGRKIVRKWFLNYRDALKFADELASRTGALLAQHISTPEGSLRKTTAAGLHVGMEIPSCGSTREDLEMDRIVSIEKVQGLTFYDLDVTDASNFFAENLLVSNSIYEFRGADPAQFIGKSDLNPQEKGDFRTLLLDTNYRSGSEIVNTANRLIAHNTKQIPMVCNAHPSRGVGGVSRKQCMMREDGAGLMAKSILDALEEVKAEEGQVPKGFYSGFGLAARTNKELTSYGMALLQAGIPFRSKVDPLGGPVVKPIVSLFTIFDPTANINDRNDAVLEGLRAPDFGLSPATVGERLSNLAGGDYYKWLTTGTNYKSIYGMQAMADKLGAYVEYLRELGSLFEKGEVPAILQFIVSYKTPAGETFGEQLAVAVKNDPEALESVKAEMADSPDWDGKVTKDMLVAKALEPMEPLSNVAEKYPSPKDFISYLGSLGVKNKKNLIGDDSAEPADVVTLDTVHGWKGLEAKHIFIPMAEGTFPSFYSKTDEQIESERRLAYVAITRGREKVTIIEHQFREAGDKVVPVSPSKFMGEACIPVESVKRPAPAPISDTESEDETPAKTATLVVGRFREPFPDWDFVDRSATINTEPAMDLLSVWGDFVK